mmetsp:Transcript_41521/g.88591  ORF Transcript_41521/g.88591 Transcript_41521/m.88591 type:complete len:230 (-) Transcript_41521:185-874(-)
MGRTASRPHMVAKTTASHCATLTMTRHPRMQGGRMQGRRAARAKHGCVRRAFPRRCSRSLLLPSASMRRVSTSASHRSLGSPRMALPCSWATLRMRCRLSWGKEPIRRSWMRSGSLLSSSRWGAPESIPTSSPLCALTVASAGGQPRGCSPTLDCLAFSRHRVVAARSFATRSSSRRASWASPSASSSTVQQCGHESRRRLMRQGYRPNCTCVLSGHTLLRIYFDLPQT